jgi:hypothetical protein
MTENFVVLQTSKEKAEKLLENEMGLGISYECEVLSESSPGQVQSHRSGLSKKVIECMDNLESYLEKHQGDWCSKESLIQSKKSGFTMTEFEKALSLLLKEEDVKQKYNGNRFYKIEKA